MKDSRCCCSIAVADEEHLAGDGTNLGVKAGDSTNLINRKMRRERVGRLPEDAVRACSHHRLLLLSLLRRRTPVVRGKRT